MPNNISFPKAEEEIGAYWKEIDAFKTQLKKSEGRPGVAFVSLATEPRSQTSLPIVAY